MSWVLLVGLPNPRFHRDGVAATKPRQTHEVAITDYQTHDVEPRKTHDEQIRRIGTARGFGITTIGIYAYTYIIRCSNILTMLHLHMNYSHATAYIL